MKKYRWEECYAKLVLEQVLPSRFYQLDILDKPDLQNINADVGVEVTTALSESDMEKDHLFSQLEQKRGTEAQRERSKERIRQLGGIYRDEGVMASWVKYMDLTRFLSALEDKLAKLNAGGYREFDNQFVFITDINMIKSDEMNEIWAEIAKRQEAFSKRFDSVFLYLYGGRLIEFDMKTGDVQCYVIPNVKYMAEKAYRISKGIELINAVGEK